MAEYDYGNGKVIVTGMTLGYLYDNGFNSAPLLHNVCAYSLSLIGSIPGWMTLTPLNGTVAPGNNMNVNIAINTTNLESGVYPVQLKFETNDPANPMFEMPVYLDYHTIPVIAANNNSIDFKNIAVGGQETKMLHIINSGCDTLIVDSMIHNLPEFIVNAILPAVILPGNHLEIPVIFEPLAMINYTDTLQIFNNDTLFHVFLLGSGSNAPVITVNPDTFYTSVNGCNNLINQPITISNITGAANLNFELYLATDSSLIISGTILPGEDSLIQIPINTEGLYSGLYINNYIIHSNDTINPDVSVTGFITINGEPIIFASSEHLDYGSILINSDSIQSFYIKNLGCDTLEIIDINTSLIEFSLQDTAFIIYPNDSVVVPVTFRPTTNVAYLDTLHIISNDTDGYVILTGTGLPVPSISIMPNIIDITINGCNTTQTTNFTIYNTGNANLQWYIPELIEGDITTTMAGGNSQDGNMFDIYAENTVQINSFDINAEDTGPYSMEIYYKNGSYVGHQSNPASWTLIGAYNVMSNGEYNYTPVVLNTPLLLNQGETYGIYVTTTGANSLSYTNGANVYSDDNITVTTGVGKEYPFGSTFTPRTWNGRINYSIGITWATCLPDSGEVAFGDSTIVAMTIDPTGLTSGVYNNFLPVVSNDPEMNMYNVPVNLTLIGQPEIVLPVANYDFQTAIVNTVKNQEFKIYNAGCDSLSITNIISSIPEFFTYDTNLTILPFDSASILVTFAPSDTGLFNGILTIENNDTVAYLVLSGQGVNAPELYLNPTSFNIVANGCDMIVYDTLHIANQGLSPLNWNFVNNSIINGDFETGNYLPWTLNPDHSASIIPKEPGSANHILSLTGGNMTAYNGITQTFAPATPNNVSYKIKPSNAPPHGVFTIGDETMSANDGVIFQYFDGTNININGYTYPYIPDEWYLFEIKNIDYINHTFDFYINGVLEQTGISFSYNCNYVSEVQLFNGFNTTSYYDEIKVGGVPTWIGLSNTSGTTDTISISDVLLTFNTTGMNDGVYNSNLKLISNDTANPSVIIPVTMTINGIPQISLSDTTIDFGQVYTGSTHTMELNLNNDGCDTLEITDIISDTAVFSVGITSFNILPGTSQILQIDFAPGIIGNYSGNLTIVNNDSQQNIVLSGEGIAPGTPIISINKNTLNFGDVFLGNISEVQVYSVSAQNLTEDLLINAPYGFQISTIPFSNFGYSIILNPSSGSISTTSIYVRFAPTINQNYSDTLVHISSGAIQRHIILTGNGLVQPEMIVSTPSLDFGSVYNGFESTESSYTIAGSGLSQDLTITAPDDFVISLTSGSGFTDELNFTPVNGIVPTTPIYVKFTPLTVKGYNDNIMHSSIGAPNLLLHVTGTSLENYLVTFNVSDGVNPISGASILINGDTLTTSGSGVAAINMLTGNYNYTVTAIGYNNYSSTISVVNQNITEDINMVLTTYDVTFNISDGTNPINGAVIALTGYGNQTTDSTGIAVFTGVVPANNIAFTVTAAGYDNVTGNVDVTNTNITENVTMNLTTYSVTFNVSDAVNPVSGAIVALTGYGNQTTNGSGVAVFNNVLPDNDITYTVTAAGYNVYNDSLNVTNSNVTENVTLTLTTYTVTFNVGDGTNPLVGATVTLNGYGSATTTTGGIAVFNNVVPTPTPGIEWTVSLTGYGPQTGNVVVDGNETVNVTLNNTIYNVIFEVFNDITGDPWVGIPVEVINEGTENTDVNGIAEFNLYGGTYNYAVKFANDTIEDNFTVPVSDTIEIAYHVGINEIGNVTFTVYPNPAKDNISISANETINQIKIMNINGVLVKAIECNERIVNIGISELASGNYFITVKTNNGKGLQKIQVRK